VFCFDSPRNYKREAHPEYKAGRTAMGETFYQRLTEFKKFLRCFYSTIEKDGTEADDLMFSLSRMVVGPHLIYTNDDDLLQAVDDVRGVKVLKSFMSKLFEWDEAKVVEKYGVPPKYLAEYRAFVGDGSDALPGAGRVDKKFVASLINWVHGPAAEWLKTTQQLLDEFKTAEWSTRERALICEHINSGRWQTNYELMKLEEVSYGASRPSMNETYVIKMLQHWQIFSLKICRQFNLIGKNEEF
jgi:5'-3' exonuclease